MRSVFVESYPVRFGEIDHAGVMYYPAIFHRIHQAFEDFWPAMLGKSYSQILDGDGIGFPLVHVEASFRRPFRFGEDIQVVIRVREVRERSLLFDVELRGGESHELRASAQLKTAVIAMDGFRGAALPSAYREVLTALVPQGPET